MPFKQSVQPILSITLQNAIASALKTNPAAALLVTPTLHLYTAGPTPITPQSVPGDFTEADFDGYAEVVLSSIEGPVNLPSGEGVGIHKEGNFVAGASIVAPGQQILGYWVDNGTTTMYLAETFDTPVPIASPGDFLSLDVMFPVAGSVAVS